MLILLSLMTLTVVNAQPTLSNNTTTFTNPFQTSSDFTTNSVTLKIHDYKALNYTNAQIIVALANQRMGWDPETGATWMGATPSLEEQSKIPQVTDPFVISDKTFGSKATAIVSPLQANVEASEDMRAVTGVFSGYGGSMSPGSIAVSTGGTNTHYVTAHLGKALADGTPCWTEIGVANFAPPTSHANYYFTYDNDEGGFAWIAPVSDLTYQSLYCIQLNGVHDSSGWQYNTYLNNVWVRSGHVAFQQNTVDTADEIFSTTNTWTHDSINAHFVNLYLYTSIWVHWNNSLVTSTIFENSGNNPMPLAQNHYLYQSSWVYDAWTI